MQRRSPVTSNCAQMSRWRECFTGNEERYNQNQGDNKEGTHSWCLRGLLGRSAIARDKRSREEVSELVK